MDFSALAKFVKTLGKDYGIPGCDISVYYNHINVFRAKSGYTSEFNKIRISNKDLYFLHSGAKIMCCVAVIILAQRYKLSLKDKVSEYIPNFDESYTIKDMIKKYSSVSSLEEADTDFSFENMKKIVEVVSGTDFDSYIYENITKPLKMKSTTFTLNDKNRKRINQQYDFDTQSNNTVECDTDVEELHKRSSGCLITTVNDYARFCETICGGGISQNGYRLLSPESVDMLINELIYNETDKNDAFVCIGYNGSLVLIDIKKKITIVYAQHLMNMGVKQLEMYPILRKTVYECIGVDTWSKGYNLFA